MNGLKPDKKVVATNLAVYARGEFIYKDCSRESIKQVMMWPDMPKFQKPCQVYYYQTKVPEIRKYGIAASAEKCAKTGKRSGWYEEQLSVFDSSNRSEALAIEEALGIHLNRKISSEEEEKWYTSIRIGLELARESKKEFDAIFLDLQQQYRAVGSKAFFETHLPGVVSRFNEVVEKLLKGELIIVEPQDKDNYQDAWFLWRPASVAHSLHHFRNKSLKALSLEEAPEHFHKRYGFKLIRDSAWH